MKHYLKQYKTPCFFIALIIVLAACNPTRNRWINRAWHSMTGHYNVYFNGEQKLNEAIEQLAQGHKNDFNKTLDVFAYGDEASAKGVSNVLDAALKKFAGTIQLHQVGNHTDDAYFGIAKAHFFKRDYFASMEALQFIISKYPAYKNSATCWIAKCYIGLGKPEEAEAVIGLLLSEKNISNKDIAEIQATSADINIKLEKFKPAIENLKKALAHGKLNKSTKIRYNYILGQLFFINENKSAAGIHFTKVIKLVSPYDYEFNANIFLTKLIDPNDKSAVNKVRKNLRKMANDDKNIEYLDQIYFELGKLELSQKNYAFAEINFKTSVSKSTRNNAQKTKSYHELAKMYFEQKNYKKAQAYYDSTAQQIDKKDKQYLLIKNTKTVLTELINNLIVFEKEDSLQRLSMLSKDALERKIDEWIANEKKEKEAAAKALKKRKSAEASQKQNAQAGGAQTDVSNFGFDNSTAWYFYNVGLVSSGAADFFNAKKWGSRTNEDFWRIAAKEKPKHTEETKSNLDSSNEIKKDEIELSRNDKKQMKESVEVSNKLTGNNEKDRWIRDVPMDKISKQQSNEKMLESMHNLGLIYFTKLYNYTECIKYFEELENRFPKNEYEPEVFYYLHKSFFELKNVKKADFYKNELITKYAEHKFSLIIQGKVAKTAESDANKEMMAFYEKTYAEFAAGNFAKAKQMKIDADKKFPGNNLRPKFEYMFALAVGKTDSVAAFKQALTFVTTEFKETDVAKEAQDILTILNKSIKREEIISSDTALRFLNIEMETEAVHYYIFAMKSEKSDFSNFVEKITTYNEDYASLENLRANAMMSAEGYQILTVRDFSNYKKALNYYKGVKANDVANKRFVVKENYIDFVISINNFKKIMKEKNIENFHTFFVKQLEKESAK